MYIDVMMQVVMGKNRLIYQKPVAMPVLPVGSIVMIDEDTEMHISGYEWNDGVIVCWLASYYAMAIMPVAEKNKPNKTLFCASGIWGCGLDPVPIAAKGKYVAAGFIKTKQRAD